ncbi:MAG TPA: GNAT family N-acetyltransferase [Gemmatimonadales bacterium]
MPGVTHDPSNDRFEIDLPSGQATLKYALEGDRLILLHTEVPREAEGQGYGGALVRAALDHAREEGLRVLAVCPFASAYLERHREGE